MDAKVLKIMGTFVGVLIALVVLLWFVLSFKAQRGAENRIIKALKSHYDPAQVEVKDRLDFKFAGSDWSYGGQICFFVTVGQPGDGVARNTVAMVADGDDGGAFKFIREYPSMRLCKADFNRG